MKSTITDLFTEIKNNSVRIKPKKKMLTNYLKEVLAIWPHVSEEEASLYRSEIDEALRIKIIVIGTFAAERAIKERKEKWIKVGIFAHALAGVVGDYRDNIRHLILIDFSAKQIGCSLEKTFNELEEVADLETRKLISDFILKQSGKSTLEDVNVKLVDNQGLPEFVSQDR